MSNSMRLVAAIAAVIVVGVAVVIGANLGTSPSSVGGPGGLSPTPAPTPSPSSTTASPQASAAAATWPIYTSIRYGFSIGSPSNWTERPADGTWTLPAGTGSAGTGGADDPMGTTTEGFMSPGESVLVSAWSAAVAPGTTTAAWIQTYCPKATAPCTGIPAQTVAVSMDGHAGSLVRFGDDDEAFFLVNNRMYIVAEWRSDNDQGNLAGYASGTLLLKDFLSTMHLLPGGPAASTSPGPS